MTRRRILRALALAVLAIAPFLLLRVPAVRAALASFVDFIRGAGAPGVIVYFGSYVGGVLLVLPIWLMSGVAGYAWGFWVGLAAALPALTLASCVVFVGARKVSRRRPSPDDRVARAVNAALHERPGAALRLTLLFRLAPVMPQNALTYVLSTTPLRTRDFALGTLVGLTPATVLHTYIGSIVSSAAALVAGEATAQGSLRWIALALGLGIFAVSAVVVGRVARRALERTPPLEPQ